MAAHNAASTLQRQSPQILTRFLGRITRVQNFCGAQHGSESLRRACCDDPSLDLLAIETVVRADLKYARDFVLLEQPIQSVLMEVQEVGDFLGRHDLVNLSIHCETL